MDVQAAAPGTTILANAQTQVINASPLPNSAQAAPTAPAITTSAAVQPAAGSGSNSSSTSSNSSSTSGAIGPTPGLATLPAGPPDGSKKHSDSDPGLSSGVATLYNVQEQNISVSFQIEQNPNEIVTVFTDKQTGKVIVQFPSETMIALAKLFDKLDGSVINKKA
jgi:hypothetical protein